MDAVTDVDPRAVWVDGTFRHLQTSVDVVRATDFGMPSSLVEFAEYVKRTTPRTQ